MLSSCKRCGSPRPSVCVGIGQARRNICSPPWRGAFTRTGDFEVRSRDYNAAWQLREDDRLIKEPTGCAVVIGAGVAGLASALGLAKWGMSVQVCARAFAFIHLTTLSHNFASFC